MTYLTSKKGVCLPGFTLKKSNSISTSPPEAEPQRKSITEPLPLSYSKLGGPLGWFLGFAMLCTLFITTQVRALELYHFHDENLRTCIEEQAVANGWHSLNDVVQLSCPNRNIRDVWGLDQLPNLAQLDLSYNPLYHLGPIHSLEHGLERLDLSGATLFDMMSIVGLHALTHLHLNDVQFIGGGGGHQQELLHQVLANNPRLTHIGLNGFKIYDPYALFPHFSPNLRSLTLSRTGLSNFPMPLDYFSDLETLDLSYNPIRHLAPAQALEYRLNYLDLSGTELYDLYELQQFRALSHLFLNEVSFSGWQDVQQLEFDIQYLLAINPQLTHLGLNGFPIHDFPGLVHHLSPGLISLELSNTGLVEFYIPYGEYPQLEVLDLSKNPLVHLHLLPEHEHSLKQLDLSETRLYDFYRLSHFTGLTHLKLNHVQFLEPHHANQNDGILEQILVNNTHLTHLGLNGIVLEQPESLIDRLSPNLVSLELSEVGLQGFPRPLGHFLNLEILDLSNNPLHHIGGTDSPNFKLRSLNLSGTRLHNLHELSQFQALRELYLNNLGLTGWVDSYSFQFELEQLLQSNPTLTHLGLSGLRLEEPNRLLQYLPRNLVSLELSDIGLSEVAYHGYSMYHLDQLQILDLSKNPLKNIGFLQDLRHSLRYVDLSETRIDGLYPLQGATGLTHLYLNDVDYQGAYLGDQEYLVNQLLMSNTGLTHVGLNGLAISNFQSLFNSLSPRLVSLELSNTGLSVLPIPLYQFMELRLIDLSYNPLQDLGPLYGLELGLEHINLSGTQLYGIDQLNDLRALTHLLLNDVEFIDPQHVYHHEFLLQTLLSQNRNLIHIGLNGFAINDFETLLSNLNPNLRSLQMSGTGLAELPFPLFHFNRLESLDLSRNPLVRLGPLYGLNHSLRELDLSETRIEGFNELLELQALTRFKVNNIEFPAYVYNSDHEHLIAEVLANNPKLSHIGLNGIQLTPGYSPVINRLASLPVTSLELANTGIAHLHELYPMLYQLEYLNLSGNGISHLFPLHQAFELRHLNLDNNDISDVSDLYSLMPQLKVLSLRRNENIPCADLDMLEMNLSVDAEFYRPIGCINDGEQPIQYCSARGETAGYEWIDTVAVNQVAHVAGNNGGYANHTSVVFEVLKGEVAEIRLTPGFSQGGYMEHWAVWIDTNNDGVFSPSEKVFSGVSNASIRGEFIIPLDAVEGRVRMRVAMRWDGAPEACGDFMWGEVNDYSISIGNR